LKCGSILETQIAELSCDAAKPCVHGEWGSQVELAQELPTAVDAQGRQFIGWNVPVVDTGPAKPSVIPPRQIAVESKVQKQIFDQHQTRMPSLQVKPVQDVELMPFDIDRNEIDLLRPGSSEDLIQGPRRNIDSAVRLHLRKIKVPIER
jgi:hypothetical protein